MRLKPQILIDLKKNSGNLFCRRSSIVNLNRSKTIRVPFTFFSKITVVFFVFLYFFSGSVFAPISQRQLSMAAQNEEQRRQLEQQLEQLETQIEQYQSVVDQYRSQGKNLEGEITRLNAKIAKLNLQIKSINLSIAKLDDEIEINQGRIDVTESEMEKNKRILGEFLQNIYVSENLGVIEVLLKKPRLSDFFNDLNNLIDIQESIKVTLDKVIELRVDLLDQKEQLAIKKNDTVALKNIQLTQKTSLSGTKEEKDVLLKITKGQESKYQDLVKETKKTAAQIRSQILRLLGGGELTFEEAYKFAKFAEQATGVRAALILSVLTQESAIDGVIGKNLGRCYYDDSWQNPEGRVMRSREASVFETLMSDLGLDPKKISVSCPISRDGLYGGAMGPAQFMPTTWLIYKDRIAVITGARASPFNNADAFIATALYLKDAGAANASLAQERTAAAKYYAGSNYRRHIWGYGEQVVSRAQDIQGDIDVISG